MIELKCKDGIMTGKADSDNIGLLICSYFEKRAEEDGVSLAEFMAKNITEKVIVDDQSPSSFSMIVPFSDSSSVKIEEREIDVEGEKGDELVSIFCQIMAKKYDSLFDDYILAVSGYHFGIVQ